MSVVVFTRSTPDTAAKVEADASGGVSWGDASTVVNPWDEYALEEGILQAKAGAGKAVVVAIGGELHNEALKHSLAMGLDEAARVEDAGIDPTDSLAYATAAAAAVKKIGDIDLVLFGKESVDVGSDQHIVQTARKLGWTMLSYVSKIVAVDYAAKTIKVERMLEEGKQVVTSKLPVVISVMKDINEPRYPSFIGIRKASKAVIPVWSLGDLGIAAPLPRTKVVRYKNLPARDTRFELIEGTPEEQAKVLVDRLIEEKVL
ncbi:MAG: electron transfer flavoprotein subunit beta/FixA family protein [Anaerolineae bacterium]|nr:electron transfer flavoprotein subunit beta/FixA family protein [Anaerolineae bacterium]NUQ03214.1 electron transfer flavoprotein subunit beta/FixA family protein [Anaerolineae bacterium]